MTLGKLFWKFIANKILHEIADTIVIKDINKSDMQEFLLKIATTPTYFGGSKSKVRIGNNVKLVNTFFNIVSGSIYIGDDTFFGHNVLVLTGSHSVDAVLSDRQKFPESGRDIHIGNGVWISSGAIILGPCTIGDHAVIAAGAVVNGGKLDGGWMYAGIPAKKVRRLFC